MKAELWEDVLEKDLGDVSSGSHFVTRAEIYPLQKTMVYHDQNRIVAVRDGEVGDEVHEDLLEGAGAFGGDGHKWGVERVGVNFAGLASGTSCDEFVDKGGHARPPIVFLEWGNGAEVSTMSTS